MIEAYDNKHENEEENTKYQGISALRELCKINKISGAELSRILGLTESAGGKILRGDYGFSKPNMKKLAEHFKVSPTLFLDV